MRTFNKLIHSFDGYKTVILGLAHSEHHAPTDNFTSISRSVVASARLVRHHPVLDFAVRTDKRITLFQGVKGRHYRRMIFKIIYHRLLFLVRGAGGIEPPECPTQAPIQSSLMP